MEKLQITIMDGIPEYGIIVKDDRAWATSNKLAEMFEKEHKDVLENIDKTIENLAADFSAVNFKKSTYKNTRGKSYRNYLITRKGFTLMAMGFTGEKALKFKVAYIENYENMEEFISTRLISKEGYKEMTSAIAGYLNPTRETYITEIDMINRLVLGTSAKIFREINNIHTDTRDGMDEDKLIQIDKAQRLNGQLIVAGVNKEDRFNIISKAIVKKEKKNN